MKYLSVLLGGLFIFTFATFADESIAFPADSGSGKIRNHSITAITSDNKVIWAGTVSGTLFRCTFNNKKWNIVKERSFGNEKITCLFIKDSSLIIGTEQNAYIYNTGSIPGKNIPEKIFIDNVSVVKIAGYKTDLWIVTKNAVNRILAGNKKIIREINFTKKQNVTIHAAFDDIDKMYIESDDGMYIVYFESEKTFSVSKTKALNGVRIVEGISKEGEIWFGTTYGLFTYKHQDTLWRKIQIDNELPDVVILSAVWYGHYLWLGTMRGLICLNTDGQQVVRVQIPETIRDVPINYLTIWQNKIVAQVSVNELVIKDVDELPYVSISGLIYKNDSIIFTGNVYAKGTKGPQLYYSPNISPLLPVTGRLTIGKTDDKSVFRAVWDISKLSDGEYILCAKVEDNRERTNTTQVPIVIGKHKNELILDMFPLYSNQQILPIGGICATLFKPDIRLSPNGSEIKFQNEKMRFSGNVSLAKGENNVVVTMYNPADGVKLTELSRNVVFDNVPPHLVIDSVFPAHDTFVVIRGKYSDLYPERIELYDFNDTIKIIPENGAFSARLKIPYGKKSFKLTAIDKAGNRTEYITSTLFDTIPPAFALIECPAYTRSDSITVSGFYNESNIESVTLMPHKKLSSIDFTSAKFTCRIPIHTGINAVECIIKDQSGMYKSEKLWVTLDRTAPSLIIDSFPLVTSRPVVSISGIIKEQYGASVKTNNNSIVVNFNKNDNKFQFNWPLLPGRNLIGIEAADLAGNITIDTVSIEYTGDKAGEKSYKELQEIVSELEKENANLRQRISSGTLATVTSNDQKLSPNKNRYIIYTLKNDETFYFLSQKFYGKIDYYQQIAEFNNLDLNQELVPGREIKIPIFDEGHVGGIDLKELTGQSIAKIASPIGYIRQAPNSSATVAGVVVKNDRIEILEKKGEWYRVQTAQGTSGWVHQSLISK